MEDYTLEREFEFWKNVHMQSIVLGGLLNYYRDLQDTGCIPLEDDPEVLAKAKLLEIFNDQPRFYKLYNDIWDVYKEAFI